MWRWHRIQSKNILHTVRNSIFVQELKVKVFFPFCILIYALGSNQKRVEGGVVGGLGSHTTFQKKICAALTGSLLTFLNLTIEFKWSRYSMNVCFFPFIPSHYTSFPCCPCHLVACVVVATEDELVGKSFWSIVSWNLSVRPYILCVY